MNIFCEGVERSLTQFRIAYNKQDIGHATVLQGAASSYNKQDIGHATVLQGAASSYKKQDIGHATVLQGAASSYTHVDVVGYGAEYCGIGLDSWQCSMHTGCGNGNCGIELR
jgi:hypothetical protein